MGPCCQVLVPSETAWCSICETPVEAEQSHLIQIGHPTEQRVAAKQRAKDGILPKRKKNHVEQHFDDCGEDLTPLGGEAVQVATFADGYSSDDEEEHIGHKILASWVTNGFQCSESDLPPPTHPGMIIAVDFEEAYPILTSKPYGVEIVEFCGGQGLTTQMVVKRQLSAGHNFELLTGCDLTDPATQKKVCGYLSVAKPLVVVMAPRCDPFGPLGRWNQVIHPEGWNRSYQESAPLATFCGEVAILQSKKADIFCVNNPRRRPFSKNRHGLKSWNTQALSKSPFTSAGCSRSSTACCARKQPI